MIVDRINRATRKIPAWPIYMVGSLWAAWLFWLGLTGGLGPEPINALEREYGSTALQLLVAGLCITPLRRYAGLNLVKYRRALGVTAFVFVVAHLTVWMLLDVQSLSRVWEDILKRPYVTIGMASFVLLIPLAITSNNMSVRRLGAQWRALHKLTYPAVLLGSVHFIWLVKGWPIEPFIYFGAIILLFVVRLDAIHRLSRG